MCEKRAAAQDGNTCYFSFSRFTINREVPAAPDNVGAFPGRQRLAHFKINRKHRGKCSALIRVDFSLYPATNFPLVSEFKGTLSPFIAASDQEGIIRRGWLHFIPKWRSYPRTITRAIPLENEINVRRGMRANLSYIWRSNDSTDCY